MPIFFYLKYLLTRAQADGSAESVYLNYGTFIQNIVDFVIIAMCIFIALKFVMKLRKKKEEEAPAPAPDPEPTPDPAAPVEVVTVEDLLDRLTGDSQGDGETEEPPQEEEDTPLPGDSGEAPPVGEALEGPIEVVGMETVLKRLETLQGVADHPMMETPFEDYTVTEGLLLRLLLSVFLSVCA